MLVLFLWSFIIFQWPLYLKRILVKRSCWVNCLLVIGVGWPETIRRYFPSVWGLFLWSFWLFFQTLALSCLSLLSKNSKLLSLGGMRHVAWKTSWGFAVCCPPTIIMASLNSSFNLVLKTKLKNKNNIKSILAIVGIDKIGYWCPFISSFNYIDSSLKKNKKKSTGHKLSAKLF